MADSTRVVRKQRGRADELTSDSLSGRAYQHIRDEILRGHLAVGDVLSRRALATKLNMSFLPITEALQRLESEGLVESKPRIGTRVRIPTKTDVLDSFIIREALESQAARMCCEHMTDKEREQLTKSAKHLDDLYRTSAHEVEDSPFLFSVHTYHMQFHMQIAALSRSPRLVKSIEKEQVLIYNWLYDTTMHRTVLPANFHSNLAKAICSGIAETADAEMRRHVQYGLAGVTDGIANLEIEKGWRLKR